MNRQSIPAHLLGLAALALALTTASCRQPPPAGPDDGDGDVGEAQPVEQPVEPLPEGAVVPVRTLRPGDPDSWRFDPQGQFLASVIDGHCGLWAIETGRYGGSFPGPAADAVPCSEWPQVERLDRVEPRRGALHVSVESRKLTVTRDGAVAFAVTCSGCAWFDAAIDRDAGRVAAAWRSSDNRAGIRVFDAATGKPLAELPLAGYEKREILDIELIWGTRLLALVGVVSDECQYLRDHPDEEPEDPSAPHPCEAGSVMTGVWQFDSLDAKPVIEPEFLEGEEIFERAYLDPSGEFLWMVIGVFWPREGLAHELLPIALVPGGRETELAWVRPPDPSDEYYESDHGIDWPLRRGWIAGPDTRHVSSQAWGMMGDIGLSWEIVTAAPTPGYDGGDMFVSAPEGKLDWQLFDARSDEGETEIEAFEYRACMPDDIDPDERVDYMEAFGFEESCEEGRVLPDGCEALAASVSLARVLGRCAGRLTIAELTADGAGTPRSLARGRNLDWLWSRAGLVALNEGNELLVWDALGERELGRVAGVEAIDHAALSEELGLVLLHTVDGAVEIYDIERAKIVVRIDDPPTRLAAFAADGSLLALSDGREIAVVELSSASVVARWTAKQVAGLAFRQDGAILFTGERRPLPERAWDPRTGEARADAELGPALLERLAAGDLDPGWRWSIHTDGWITRTVDGRELWLGLEAALSDRGSIAGDPGEIDGYNLRIGPDPSGPVYTPEQLASLLARPSLVADFFAGLALPKPELTPEAIAAALAHAANEPGGD